jgi:Tol biopolymer transport system component
MGFKTPEALAGWVSTRTLWVSAADGSRSRQLTAAGTGVYLLGWSRDGSRLLFARGGAVWLMDTAGGEPQQIIGRLPGEKDLFGFYGYASYHDEIAWYQR